MNRTAITKTTHTYRKHRTGMTLPIVVLCLFIIFVIVGIGSSAWNIHLRTDSNPTTSKGFATGESANAQLLKYVSYNTTETVTINGKEYPSYTYDNKSHSPELSNTVDNQARELPTEWFTASYAQLAVPFANDDTNWDYFASEEELESAPVEAGIYRYTVTPNDDAGKYKDYLGEVSVIFVINPRPVSVWIISDESVYGNKHQPNVMAEGENFLSNDYSTVDHTDISFRYKETVAAAADDDSILKTLTETAIAGDYEIIPTDTSLNYNVTYVYGNKQSDGTIVSADADEVDFTINKRKIEVRFDTQNISLSKVYGEDVDYSVFYKQLRILDEENSIRFTYENGEYKNTLWNNDDIESVISLSSNVLKTSNAGDYQIVPELISSNYEIYVGNDARGLYVVTKAPLTLKANDTDVIYGENAEFTVLYSGFVLDDSESDLTGEPTFECDYSVGSYAGTTFTITPDLSVQTNYYIITATGELTVVRRPITVEIKNSTSVYGDEVTTDILQSSIINGTVYGDDVAYTLSTTANSSSSVGNYPVSVSADNDNYAITCNNNNALLHEITKATLTVTAEDKTITYGDALPEFSSIIEGAKNGDTFEISYSTNYTKSSNVGSYDIIPSTSVTYGNYDITFVNGTLTVEQRIIELEWVEMVDGKIELTYNGLVQTPTAISKDTSIECNFVVTIISDDENAGKDVGTYIAEVSASANSNYILPEDTTVEFTIVPRPITIEWSEDPEDFKFEYDGEIHGPIPTVSNIIEGDDCSFTFDGGASEVGVYFARISDLTNPNYVLPEGAGTFEHEFEIVPKVISLLYNKNPLPENPIAFTYNGAVQYPTAFAFVDGEILTAEKNLVWMDLELAESSKDARETPYSINVILKGDKSGNYKLERDFVEYKINRKTLTVTQLKPVYNGQPQKETVTITTAIFGEQITAVSIFVDANGDPIDDPINAGTYKAKIIELIGGDGVNVENYVITNATYANSKVFNFTISQAPLKVTPKTVSVNVGDPKPSFEIVYDGFVNGEDESVIPESFTYEFNCTYTETSAPGRYTITIKKNPTLTNYEVTAVEGYLYCGMVIAKPTVVSMEYNGEEQTFIPKDFDPEKMTIDGNIQTDAGTYTATISLKQEVIDAGFTWEDGTTAPFELTWTISRMKVPQPVDEFIEFVYDKESHYYTLPEGYNESWVTLSYPTNYTDSYYINVGNRTVYINLNDNYQWENGTTTQISRTWKITRAIMPLITPQDEWVTEFVYDGTPHIPFFAEYDEEAITEYATKWRSWGATIQIGTYNASSNSYASYGNVNFKTPAGLYRLNINPGSNCMWPDGSYSTLTVIWEIKKAIVTIPDEVTYFPDVGFEFTTEFEYNKDKHNPLFKDYDEATVKAFYDNWIAVQGKNTMQIATFSATTNAFGSYSNIYSQTNPGTYSIKISLSTNYTWPDGSTDPIIQTWVINKAVMVFPEELTTEFVYDGNPHTPFFAEYDEEKVTAFFTNWRNLNGTNSIQIGIHTLSNGSYGSYANVNFKTDANEYAIKFTLGSYCTWPDGTNNSIILDWRIKKKTLTFTNNYFELDPTSYKKWQDIETYIRSNLDVTGIVGEDDVQICTASLVNGLGIEYKTVLNSTTGVPTTYSAVFSGQYSGMGITSANAISSFIGSTYKSASLIASGAKYKNYEVDSSCGFILKYKTVLVGTNTTNYYTIEDALARVGDIIITAKTASGDYTRITSFTGFTFEGANFRNYSNTFAYSHSQRIVLGSLFDGTNGLSHTSVSNSVHSCLIIPGEVKDENGNVTFPGITLNLSANIVVPGVVGSGGGVSDRGVIFNNGTINIESATIYAYGYIKGSGTINMKNVTVYDVFRTFDFKGGQLTYGTYEVTKEYLPISVYSVHNISCKAIIPVGCNYYAAYFFTMGGQDFDGNITVIGTGNGDSLFTLTSGYIEKSTRNATSDPNNAALGQIAGSNQTAGQLDVVKTYGNTNDGTIKIEVSFVSKVTMQTGLDNPLPVSFMEIIVGNDGNGNVGTLNLSKSSYKFMPGTSLTVEQGATLNVDANVQMVFYANQDNLEEPDEYKDHGNPSTYSDSWKFMTYCKDKVDSYLLVNGTANINGRISGLIKSSSIGALLKIGTPNTEITLLKTVDLGAKELNLIIKKQEYAAVTTKQVKANAVGLQIDNIESEALAFAGGTYTSSKITDSEDLYYWITADRFRTISFDYNGGTGNVYSKAVVLDKDSNGNLVPHTLVEGELPIAVRSHYVFLGWYMDSSLNTPAVGQSFSSDITLYAKFEPEQYSITYTFPGLTNEQISNIVNNNANTYRYGDSFAFVEPSHNELTFIGWYKDENFSEQISSIVSSDYGNITLFGKWTNETKHEYKVSIESGKSGVTLDRTSQTFNGTLESGASGKITTIMATWNSHNAELNSDFMNSDDFTVIYSQGQYNFDSYFSGWKLSYNDAVGTYCEVIYEEVNSRIEIPGGATNIKLIAQWKQKAILKFAFVDIYSNNNIGETKVKYFRPSFAIDTSLVPILLSTMGTFEYYDFSSYEFIGEVNGTNLTLGEESGDESTLKALYKPWYIIKISGNVILSAENTDNIKVDATNKTIRVSSNEQSINLSNFVTAPSNGLIAEYSTTAGSLDQTTLNLPQDSGNEITVTASKVLTRYNLTLNNSNTTITVNYTGYYSTNNSVPELVDASITNDCYIYSEGIITSISVEAASGYKDPKISKVTMANQTLTNYNNFTITGDVEVTATSTKESSGGGCLAAGTLITMADGSFVPIENVRFGDEILSWNFFTGRFEAQPAIYLWDYGEDEYNIINLIFANGTKLRLIAEHGLFDTMTNSFEFIDESNYMNYIGHEFVVVNGNEKSTTKLVDAYISHEITYSYSLETAQNGNAIAEGMLTLTPQDIIEVFMCFELGDNMQFDQAKMQADIEQYGLYTYEEWSEYVTAEEFYAFNGQYMKIIVEKGLVTEEQLKQYILRWLG